MTTMPRYIMEFYNASSGVQFKLRWRDEREFYEAQAFLKENDVRCAAVHRFHREPRERRRP